MGVATACFVFARCLQLGNAVVKNEAKSKAYYEKVHDWFTTCGGGSKNNDILQAKEFDKNVVAELHNQLLHDQI